MPFADEAAKNKGSLAIGTPTRPGRQLRYGLFVNHFGKERNIPIIRIGNIAAMPEQKVKTKRGAVDAILIESRSIGGLSGSPVFAHLAGVRRGNMKLGAPPIFLLGLMHGHWDVEANKQDDILQTDQFQREHVNMGIAIVVPVQKIIETMNQPKLVKRRERDMARIAPSKPGS